MYALKQALREPLRHPLRTGLAVVGVAAATALLLDMLMLGAGMQRSLGEMLRGEGYEVRVSPRGTLPLETDATMPGASALRDSLEAAPGVAGAAPVLAANLLLRPADGDAGAVRAFAVGVDPGEQGLYRLLEGRDPAGSGEVLAEAEGPGGEPGTRLVLSVPDALEGAAGGGREYRVVGTADFLYASPRDRALALELGELQSLTGRWDRVSFFMVRLEPGVGADEAAAELRRLFPDLEVASAGELVRRTEGRLAYFRQLAVILGTVSLIVAALLVGTLTAVSVGERAGTLAALRAIGVSRRSLVTWLGAETLFVCAVAAGLGLGLGLGVAAYLETILADFPGLPRAVRFFVLRPRDLALAFGLVLAAGLAAALVPTWRATTREPAAVLSREEP